MNYFIASHVDKPAKGHTECEHSLLHQSLLTTLVLSIKCTGRPGGDTVELNPGLPSIHVWTDLPKGNKERTNLPKGMKRTHTTLGWIYIEGLTAGAAAQLLTKANNHAKQ